MTLWDVAAGNLVAAFLVICIVWGFRDRRERPLAIICGILAAALVLYRGACWSGSIACDAEADLPVHQHPLATPSQ